MGQEIRELLDSFQDYMEGAEATATNSGSTARAVLNQGNLYYSGARRKQLRELANQYQTQQVGSEITEYPCPARCALAPKPPKP